LADHRGDRPAGRGSPDHPESLNESFAGRACAALASFKGVWLYGEHFTGGGPKIAIGALALAAMVIGVVFLARTARSFTATPAESPVTL
jgi:hypothetical protein